MIAVVQKTIRPVLYTCSFVNSLCPPLHTHKDSCGSTSVSHDTETTPRLASKQLCTRTGRIVFGLQSLNYINQRLDCKYRRLEVDLMRRHSQTCTHMLFTKLHVYKGAVQKLPFQKEFTLLETRKIDRRADE